MNHKLLNMVQKESNSFRNYNACFLCLQTARDPVCCNEGHLACRECMYESILQQKQAIKQEERFLEVKKQEDSTQNSKRN
ncbi:unnamed protein product [Mucor hiemalis]